MFALVGFAVGYVVGANAGREGLQKLLSSAQAIQTSDEFAALLDTGRMMLTQIARQAIETAGGLFSGEFRESVDRRLQAA